MTARLAALLLGFGMAGLAHAQDAQTTAATVCAACHGADGNSLAPMFPTLAGLQENYIVKQLNDFMSGKRKNDMMSPIAAQLKPEDVQPLAAYFSKQKRARGTSTNRMAASAGKVLYNQGNDETGVPACIGCHQPKGAGSEGASGLQNYTYPKLANQQIDYIKSQLKNFATGERSNDPNRFMRVTAKRMTDEEMEEVAQYLAGVGD
ncbi:MAG: cytochrome c4 [Betaproteobacteria bacterium]|nr:cytochrome c4 [Betaproteobacteria bacterium]